MLSFSWDPEKENSNIQKHDGINFQMAARVFLDDHVIVRYDSEHSSLTEDRWNAIGMVEEVLFVVFTEIDEDCIRIISARKAEKEEKYEYYKNYNS